MISQQQIVSLLKINGFDSSASDDQIRAVLQSANYNESDIEAAINLLKNGVVTQDSKSYGLHNVMYSDKPLHTSEVSALLGIDIHIDPKIPFSSRSIRSSLNSFEQIGIILLSVIIAVVAVVVYMYFFEVGIFHPTVDAAWLRHE